MAVEAAVRGDITLLKQAMLHDPLLANENENGARNENAGMDHECRIACE